MSERNGEYTPQQDRNLEQMIGGGSIDADRNVVEQSVPEARSQMRGVAKTIENPPQQETPQGFEHGSSFDSQETPRLHVPPTSEAYSHGQEKRRDAPEVNSNDYFGFQAPQQHQEGASHTRALSSPGAALEAGLVTPGFKAAGRDSPGEPLTIWKHPSPKSARPPTSDPNTTRPVSLHTLPSGAAVVPQVESQDHVAGSPDQSVSPRSHPGPSPARMPRTRSSHSANWSHSPIKDDAAKEILSHHNGARTVGNTPVQSPGVYPEHVRSPTSTIKRAPGSDDGRPNSAVLQATHLKEPIETHKLNKDFDPVSGRKVLNSYELIEKLGSGQHGTVKRGRNTLTGDAVAVKIVRRISKKLRLGRADDPNEMVKKEIAILKKARHPHVVSLFEVIDDPEFDKVYLVLEFVERGEIVWRKMAEKGVAQYERERVNREIQDGYDADYERRAIDVFNDGVPIRRAERRQLLQKQRRQTSERIMAQQSNWVPDYNRKASYDFAVDDVRMSRADVHAAENAGESPQSATPVYGPKFPSISHALSTEFSTSHASSQSASAASSMPPSQPSSRPPSRPRTPLEGTMYGPYIEETSKTNSDLEFQRVLNEIIEEQAGASSLADEEHRYAPCLTLSQISEVVRDTLLGIEYLHYHGIIHRDIKPANLLWTRDYRVKISDFGVSYLGKPIREDEDTNLADDQDVDETLELAKTVGTPAFYAPELCDPDYFDTEKQAERPLITGQIDIWALGVTLYGMVFGRLPFFALSEFAMYEKIAHEDVYIPFVRLKGVSHTDKTPSNHNKRLDDVIEYEPVDDTLRDLLKRLLAKHPKDRITLKEVKHHPWVVSGVEDKDSWLDETDPSRQNENRKIEVSHEEIEDAFVELSFVDKFVKGLQRLGSVMRGGRSRKRTTSSSKDFQAQNAAAVARIDDRRSSLRGDEQIFAALKQSREGAEHPLARSVAASPDLKTRRSYFGEDINERPHSALEASARPISDRSMSTADSMKTVTARDSRPPRPTVLAPPHSTSAEDLLPATAVSDQFSSTSSLSGIFGAGRRLANTFRSRDGGQNRQSPSQSSRSSSVDTNAHNTEDYHASPSLGFSSAIAAGHVDLPPALREEAEEHHVPTEADSFQLSQERNAQRQQYAHHPKTHRRSVSHQPDSVCTVFPNDEVRPQSRQQRPSSAAESSFAISSSSDMIVSGDSTAHSRIPSIVSGASSLSTPAEEDSLTMSAPMQKSTSSSTAELRPDETTPHQSFTDRQVSDKQALEATPALESARAQQEDESGYSAEVDDSDSDEGGLTMA